MQRLDFFLLFLTCLLAGCGSKAAAQAAEVRALKAPTLITLPEVVTSTPAEITSTEVVSHNPPASCPVTIPQDPAFTAPEPYSASSPFEGQFWYGSTALWTALPQDGVWFGLPHNPQGYTQKVFWWREGYVWNEEPEPALIVNGERLDALAPPLIASKATNAYASDIGSAMLVGVDFPALGCWKITGQYKDAELSFVLWVAP